MTKLTMPPNCINDTDKNVGAAFAVIGVGALAEGDDEHRAAYHEAGHSVIARVLGVQCGQATIVPDGLGYDGYAIAAGQHSIHRNLIERGDHQDFRSSVLTKIMVCLGGPEAEAIMFGDCDARGDMHMIEELCARYFISGEDVNQLQPQVHSLLIKHWPKVEAVAAALLEKKTLSGAEIDVLVHDNS